MPVPDGGVASTASDALRVAKELNSDRWVIKAQVHAGGRGKAGGVKVVDVFSDLYDLSANMLGMKIVTKQTGAEGKIVRRILVEKATDIEKEIYLSFLVDRDSEQHMIIASSEGGMDIEEVAERTPPEKVIKERINPVTGMGQFLGRKIAKKMGLDPKLLNKFADIANKLYQCFVDHDGMMLEINPLVVTGAGDIVCSMLRWQWMRTLYSGTEPSKR